jgi:hypothetical protein
MFACYLSACRYCRRGQLIRELKLGGVNHEKMGKNYHRENFPPHKKTDTTLSPLLTNSKRDIFKITNRKFRQGWGRMYTP